jgi:hypothetical protein
MKKESIRSWLANTLPLKKTCRFSTKKQILEDDKYRKSSLPKKKNLTLLHDWLILRENKVCVYLSRKLQDWCPFDRKKKNKNENWLTKPCTAKKPSPNFPQTHAHCAKFNFARYLCVCSPQLLAKTTTSPHEHEKPPFENKKSPILKKNYHRVSKKNNFSGMFDILLCIPQEKNGGKIQKICRITTALMNLFKTDTCKIRQD